MTRLIKVAATQMPCEWDLKANVDLAEQLIRQAVSEGANVVLIQELFETPYFCIEQDSKHLQLASRLEDNNTIQRFSNWPENCRWYCRSAGLNVRVRYFLIRWQ